MFCGFESFMEQNLFIKRHLTKNKNKYINIYIIKTCFVAVKMYFQIRQAYYETYHQNPKNSPTLFFGWKYVGVNFVKRIIFLGVVYVGKYYSKLPFTKSYMCVL